MKPQLPNGWKHLVPEHIIEEALNKVIEESRRYTIYPEKANLFRAFELCDYNSLKVVILGQDPYFDGSANGLSFSNKSDTLKISPSLKNIFKEVEEDTYDGMKLDQSPDLSRWAEQGVLLLNTALTVRKNQAGSQINIWKDFTETLLTNICAYNTGIIYMLWGNKSKYYKKFLNEKTNHMLEAGHPSPLNTSIPFKGCKHFSKSNQILKQQDQKTIKW